MNVYNAQKLAEFEERCLNRYGSDKSPSFKRLRNIYKKILEANETDVSVIIERAKKIKFLTHTTSMYDHQSKIFFAKFLYDAKEIVSSMSEEPCIANVDLMAEIINFRKNERCLRTYILPEINDLEELKTISVYGRGMLNCNEVLIPALRVHEVLAQIPERTVNKICAFEIINWPKKQEASRVPDGYFEFTVRLYTGKLPEDLDFSVFFNGTEY